MAHLRLPTSDFRLPIVHPQNDDALRLGQYLLRISPAILVTLQPRHIASMPVLEPRAEFRRMRRRDAAGDSAEVEAKTLGERDERGFHAAGCHEKARRASAITASAASACD